METESAAPEAGVSMPKKSLFRAVYPGLELREASAGTGMPTMVGHFAVFNQFTEINSAYEGRFLERIAPGAFTKTLKENRDNIRVLFQHGRDPQVGDKPLGPIENVREDENGAAYEVPLLDTSYNRDLIPGLQAGLYGASFRFQVMKEEVNQKPKRSAYNPDGLPERTISEAKVLEFGPVTFPAYEGATAGVRSLTDRFLADTRDHTAEDFDALPADGAAPAHSDDESRDENTEIPAALDTTEPAEATPSKPSRNPSAGRLASATRARYTLNKKEEKPSWLL